MLWCCIGADISIAEGKTGDAEACGKVAARPARGTVANAPPGTAPGPAAAPHAAAKSCAAVTSGRGRARSRSPSSPPPYGSSVMIDEEWRAIMVGSCKRVGEPLSVGGGHPRGWAPTCGITPRGAGGSRGEPRPPKPGVGAMASGPAPPRGRKAAAVGALAVGDGHEGSARDVEMDKVVGNPLLRHRVPFHAELLVRRLLEYDQPRGQHPAVLLITRNRTCPLPSVLELDHTPPSDELVRTSYWLSGRLRTRFASK